MSLEGIEAPIAFGRRSGSQTSRDGSGNHCFTTCHSVDGNPIVRRHTNERSANAIEGVVALYEAKAGVHNCGDQDCVRCSVHARTPSMGGEGLGR